MKEADALPYSLTVLIRVSRNICAWKINILPWIMKSKQHSQKIAFLCGSSGHISYPLVTMLSDWVGDRFKTFPCAKLTTYERNISHKQSQFPRPCSFKMFFAVVTLKEVFYTCRANKLLISISSWVGLPLDLFCIE